MPEGDRHPSDVGYLNDAERRLDIQHAVVVLATAQQLVFSLAQAKAIGLSARAAQRWAASGRLHRVYRSVYSMVPRALLSRNGSFMAAVLACGPGAVLSHRSAAALHELRATDRAGIDVTVPGRTTHRHKGIDIHRSLTLTAADITTVDGIPCTTIARTQFDLADVVSPGAIERAYNQAEIIKAFDLRALNDQLARNRHRHATPRVRAVLQKHYVDATPTETKLEQAFFAVCRASGVPVPERQVWVVLEDGELPVRADFLWRTQRLIIETDGGTFHRTRQAFESDRRRDQRLTAAGWRVVRVTWRQIKEDPARIARLVNQLLNQ
jgi:very-short-patch-repair endonuclease